MAGRIEGNITGLKPLEMKSLLRLYQRRYPVAGGYTQEQAKELTALSRLISRQIAVLIDRQGHVAMVIVGDKSSICIPELPQMRIGQTRLRGLRLFHTHLTDDLISREDMMDLLFLRLDSVSVLTSDENGFPKKFQIAYLVPPSHGEKRAGYKADDPVPWDKVTIDFSAQIEELEQAFTKVCASSVTTDSSAETHRAVLVSVSLAPKDVQEQYLDELSELAKTAGIEAVDRMIQRVSAIHPRHILGKEKMAELEIMTLHGQADMIIFDGELTPAQAASIQEETERIILDRTQLILDIFAKHAVTKAGKLQVELARLRYALPRLSGRGMSMDRITGGISGNKGVGETKLELERRRIRERIGKIKKELDILRKQRFHTRAHRIRENLPVAALVGYTNAGKSTLLNAMTNADVLTENKLFATLDPTTRRLRFPEEREIVLADTVGFIRDLPEELMEAFRATLEELEAADLLIHVVDASHPEWRFQMESVEHILTEINLDKIPRITLMNKWDSVPETERVELLLCRPETLAVSGLTGQGLKKVTAAIEKKLFDGNWHPRESLTWEQFEKAARAAKKRKMREKTLDDNEALWQ